MVIKISSKQSSKNIASQLESLSGQNVYRCIQCGYCSGSCPMTDNMDALPRRVIHLAQLNLHEQLETLKMYWVCTSCQNCGVACPRGIDLPRIMEALRLMTLRRNLNYIDPLQVPFETVKECPQIALVAAFRKLTS
ncbi:4Fe-4S dicluster domain-containing protein [Thermodesulfobacteriota bacterium]